MGYIHNFFSEKIHKTVTLEERDRRKGKTIYFSFYDFVWFHLFFFFTLNDKYLLNTYCVLF